MDALNANKVLTGNTVRSRRTGLDVQSYTKLPQTHTSTSEMTRENLLFYFDFIRRYGIANWKKKSSILKLK